MSNAQDDSERYGSLRDIFNDVDRYDPMKVMQELITTEMAKQIDKEVMEMLDEKDKDSSNG